MKIYTKTGDTGDTSLFAGGRVRKTDRRVNAYGDVDELNSVLGFIRSYDLPDDAQNWLEDVQNDLFIIGADLATPLSSSPEWLVRLDATAADKLEAAIDEMDEALPALKSFILPGGAPAAGMMHIARTVCRRAERAVIDLNDHEPVNVNVIVYLNRLSDFLFTLARWTNQQAGVSETKWQVR